MDQTETFLDCKQKRTLVVLLHAYALHSNDLVAVEKAVKSFCGENVEDNLIVLRLELPASTFSMSDPNEIVIDIIGQIDQKVAEAAESERPIEDIFLIGHSLGALLARKLYVVACGSKNSVRMG